MGLGVEGLVYLGRWRVMWSWCLSGRRMGTFKAAGRQQAGASEWQRPSRVL